MSGRNAQRKLGTARGSPRRSRTAKASRISRAVGEIVMCLRGGRMGPISVDGPDRITRFGARAPEAEYNPTPRRHTKESSARHSAGQPLRTPQCAKDGGKPGVRWRMPGAGLSQRCTGKVPSDMPAFQPYRGKPAVRNDRGDGGNVGIIRSPLRATVLPACGGRSAMVVPTATVASPRGSYDRCWEIIRAVSAVLGHQGCEN
jgi:hypothetical protein